MIDASPEIGDQLQPLARRSQYIGVDTIRYRGNKDVAVGHGQPQVVGAKRLVARR